MLDYVPPVIEESINRLTFVWEAYGIRVVADRLNDDGRGELGFWHFNGHGDKLLHLSSVNLLSTPTVAGIAKKMATHSTDIPWSQMMTLITAKAIEYMRQGESPLELEPLQENFQHPGYFVDPIVLRGSPNIIFGDEGVNKTTLALTILANVAFGERTNNTTGLICRKPVSVGMLDWESNAQLTAVTLKKLIHTDTAPYITLPYLRCSSALVDDIARISQFVSKYHIQLLLIDSLGAAAGSDQYDSAGKRAALRFFEALRKLNVTSLIIAQNAKGNEDGKRSIYGSTFYGYYARNIFELRGKPDEKMTSTRHIALFHTKANYSEKHDPIAFCVTYTVDGIAIESEAYDFKQFMASLSQSDQVLAAVQDGCRTTGEISKKLQIPTATISVVLNRLAKKKLVKNVGQGVWISVEIEDS